MKLVIVESPYAGNVERNLAYAKLAIRDCLERGEAPIASHLLFTQKDILNDDVPGERKLGIAAGHAWYRAADRAVVYVDFGFSSGMDAGMREAFLAGTPIEIRKLNPSAIEELIAKYGN